MYIYAGVLMNEKNNDPYVYAIGGFTDRGFTTDRVDVFSEVVQQVSFDGYVGLV